MFDCSNVLHPFQNDPGVSQHQRIMEDLLFGPTKIDGRTMADLLDYFVQLSRHINYYNKDLSISDWQPFFQKSLPFSLAAIIKYDTDAVTEKIGNYSGLFQKHPSPAGLQLLFHYIFYQVINNINTWHLQLNNSGLPSELIITKLIKDKLRKPLENFICYHNVAVRTYCIKAINFLPLSQNEVWGLDTNKLRAEDCKPTEETKRKKLIALYDQIKSILPSFLDVIRIIADTSEQCIEQSFSPLKEELQKKHPPHLALLFSFLKLFQHLQSDLNSFTKKHLDFFYKEVLKLKANESVPDKVHLVFEIQKQLDSYLLKKGLVAKDGKDNNKAEILFSLDDEIVVNKTQVADKRTLFLNNKNIFEKTYPEGVYMAPDAGKADGVSKEFKGSKSKSFPTLGAKLSKYTDPEKSFAQPYPNARLGFILASPVLFLGEGEREVNITLACKLEDNYCSDLPEATAPGTNNCCEERDPNIPSVVVPPASVTKKYQEFIGSTKFYSEIKAALEETYYYISEDLITEAKKKGISKELEEKLRDLLTETKTKDNSSVCYCPIEIEKYDTVLNQGEWNTFYGAASADEKKILGELFTPLTPLKILFSGEKEWIESTSSSTITITPPPLAGDRKFLLNITAKLATDKPAVTFYDKDKLKEDFNTTLPLVKIELDDKIKMLFSQEDLEEKIGNRDINPCCLLNEPSSDNHAVSLYHFFRNVTVTEEANGKKTQIDVKVCGLKNFVVQNDESVQDVNGPVYPFGTRPEIIDFDIKNPPSFPLDTNLNLKGPNFYIGSKEVFCKKWEDVYINIEWKDKPTYFHDYYKGYLKDGTDFGLDDRKFLVNLSVLEEGKWEKENNHATPTTIPIKIKGIDYNDRKLFDDNGKAGFCTHSTPPVQTIRMKKDFFSLDQQFRIDDTPFTKYDVSISNGFLKLNLQMQDFCHKVYSYVLSRQMMALGKLPDGKIEDAIYYDATSGGLIVFSTDTIKSDLEGAGVLATRVEDDINNNPDGIKDKAGSQGSGDISESDAEAIRKIILPPTFPHLANKNLTGDVIDLKNIINNISGIIDNNDKFQAIIPNEPWTPIIKEISLDYTATAPIEDIDLVHLYPYENTYKHEEITLQPTLLPTFCDEGTLFLGLKDLEPGNNVNILFQLAEATADSESEREDVNWYYLDNNQWKSLRPGFEILDDATDGLTTSGIVKFALPENMTNGNTILPKELHWIKASIPKNSNTVCETMGIYTQAILSTFTNTRENDKLRMAAPLASGAISKLNEADANVKKLTQPYDSFGGRVPEGGGHFYVRVSELLRHKGRAIQKFDYERLALEAFPQLFKVKCINHSFALNGHQYKNDFPVAPGYVLLAVIPDLNQLKAAQSFEPRVPVSMLENIAGYMNERTSPFVRFRAMNPRYEKVNFCLKVKLLPGKDENYYKEKLKQDIRELLAPWAVGQYDKLSFGQCVNRSDIIRLVETSDYVDFISALCMVHEEDDDNCTDLLKNDETIISVCPKTPRSILIAGDIDVCIPGKDCEEWGEEKCENEVVPIADYCPKVIIS